MSSRKRKKAPFLDRNTKKMIRRVFAIDVSTPRLRGRPATTESAHACFELLEDEVDMMARCVKHREAVFSESKELVDRFVSQSVLADLFARRFATTPSTPTMSFKVLRHFRRCYRHLCFLKW